MSMVFQTILPNKDIGRIPAIYIQKMKPERYHRSARDNNFAKLCMFVYEYIDKKSSIIMDDKYVITLFYREY